MMIRMRLFVIVLIFSCFRSYALQTHIDWLNSSFKVPSDAALLCDQSDPVRRKDVSMPLKIDNAMIDGKAAEVYVDGYGSIYWGKPDRQFDGNRTSNLSVGVPFVSLFGKSTLSDRLKIYSWNVDGNFCVRFVGINATVYGDATYLYVGKVASGNANGQIVYRRDYLVQYGGFDWASGMPDPIPDWTLVTSDGESEKITKLNDRIVYDFTHSTQKEDIKLISPIGPGMGALEGMEVSWSWHGTSDGEEPVKVDDADDGVTISAPKISKYPPGFTFKLKDNLNSNDFSRLDKVSYCYKTLSDHFKIWAFEDDSINSNDLGVPFINVSSDSTCAEYDMNKIYDTVRRKYSNLLNDGVLDRSRVKVMYVPDGSTLTENPTIKIYSLKLKQSGIPGVLVSQTPEPHIPTYSLNVTANRAGNDTTPVNGLVTIDGAHLSASLTNSSANFQTIPAGTYKVFINQPGYTFAPEAISWTAGSVSKVNFVAYRGEPRFQPDNPAAITVREGSDPIAVDLSKLASDPSYPNLIWSIGAILNGPKDFVRLDAANKLLYIGKSGSNWNGVFSIPLIVQNSAGASQTRNLLVNVTPVNTPPTILGTEIRVQAGKDTAVDLDRTGASAFVMDPDNTLQSLQWSLKFVDSIHTGISAKLIGHSLQVTAGLQARGSYSVDLSVSDRDTTVTKRINLIVAPPALEILSAQGIQDANSDIQVSFLTRSCAEVAALPRGQIAVLNVAGSKWAFPASLTVEEEPKFYNGVWSDGVYRATIASTAIGTANGATPASVQLVNLLTPQGTLGLSLDVACAGAITNQKITVSDVDFHRPKASLSLGVVYDTLDTALRSPTVLVHWNWDEPGVTAKLVQVTTKKGGLVKTVEVGTSANDAFVPGLVDGASYSFTVVGVSSKGTTGGGVAKFTIPSGHYRVAVTLDDHTKSQVTGSLCLSNNALADAPVCQSLRRSASGSYAFAGLVLGNYSLTIQDPKWVLAGGALDVPVNHVDPSVVGQLVPASFLVPGSMTVNEEQGSGDLIVGLEVSNQFAGEKPQTLQLVSKDLIGSTIPARSATLSMDAGSFKANGNHWELRWTRTALSGMDGAKALFQEFQKRRWKKGTLVTGMDGVSAFRSDSSAIGASNTWNVSSFQVPVMDSMDRRITSAGKVTWTVRGPLRHGARIFTRLSEPSTDDADKTLPRDSGFFAPANSLLEFRLDAMAAFTLNGYDNLVESMDGSGMRVPLNLANEAGSQWMVWAKTERDYDLRVHWTAPSFATRRFKVTLDSGKTWVLNSTYGQKDWKFLGTVHLKAGWNPIGIAVEGGTTIAALSLRPADTAFDKALDPNTLRHASDTVDQTLERSLALDHVYRAEFVKKDEYGQASIQSDDFRVAPGGLFSDATLVQEEGTGDLLLRTTESALDAIGLDNTKVTLPGSTTQIKPASHSFMDPSNPAKGIEMRIARKDLPTDFLANTALLHGSNLEPILLTTTVPHRIFWSERHCSYWFSCHTDLHFRDVTDTKQEKVFWSGHPSWTSGHDLRPLPPLSISLVRSTTDSLYLRADGLEGEGTSYRGTAATTLTANWIPGSNCASTTTVKVPARSIFVTDTAGAVAFSPVLEAAYTSQEGKPTQSTAGSPGFNHQWLDHGHGGGFYPAAVDTFGVAKDDAARVGFLVRGAMATPRQVRLWVAPDSGAGISRKSFLYRLRRYAPEDGSNWQTGSAFSTTGSWQSQGSVLTLDTGLQILEFRMVHAGVAMEGVQLVPVDSATPTQDPSTLARLGSESPKTVYFSAPNLSPGTMHTVTVQAQDRWGNASPSVTAPFQTLKPSQILPGVRLGISPWDSSAWLKVGSYTLTVVPSSALTGSPSSIVKARFYKKDDFGLPLNPQDIALTNDAATGKWSGTLPSLAGYAALPGNLASAPSLAVEAWMEDGTSKGVASAIGFQVRTDDRPAYSTSSIQDGPVGGALTFKVLQSWTEGGQTYANLSVPSMQINEDDTGANLLLLRGALIATANGALASISAGTLASMHCHVTEAHELNGCMDQAQHPLTLGRWTGHFDVAGSLMRDGKLLIKEAAFLDDQDRPSRSSSSFYWSDKGLDGTLDLGKDRFWIGNVVAATDEEAFGLEGCQTKVVSKSGGLDITLKGCSDSTGPFLTFPLHMRTSGMWSLVGNAFDSIAKPYKVGWQGTPTTKWVDGSPEIDGTISLPNDVDISQSALRNVFGASLWGYDIKGYKFGTRGVTDLQFDVLFPESPVTPKVKGEFQRITGFTGGSIVSRDTLMNGKPVLAAATLATSDARSPQIGQTLSLDGLTGWTYRYLAGQGWTLVPNASQLYVTGPQRDGWKLHVGNDGQTERFRLPFKTLVLGPGTIEESSIGANGSQQVSIDAGGGTTLQTTLSVDPGDDGFQVSASSTSVMLNKFFTRDDNFVPQSLSDVEFSLNGEFQLKDIDAIGSLADPNLDVKLMGYGIVSFLPSSRYQVMANRGRVFVRLFRPQVQLNLDPSEQKQPGTSVQTVVLTTTRIPVAVGASVPVPEGKNLLKYVGLEALGTLAVDQVQLDASAELKDNKTWGAKLGLQASTLIELGSAFDMMGLKGTRLPLKSARLELKSGVGNWYDGADVSFETSPMGFALDMGWTMKDIQTMFSLPSTSSGSNPTILRLRTQGWPLSVNFRNQVANFSLENWELQLTKDFPIQAMANTSFFLNKLAGTATISKGSSPRLSIETFNASGSKTFPDGLALVDGVTLLGAGDSKEVTVSVSSGAKAQDTRFKIQAGRISIKDKTYNLSNCKGEAPAWISVGLDGSINGGTCFNINERVPIYPIASLNPELFIPAPSNGQPGVQVSLSFSGGVLAFGLRNVKIQSRENIWNGQPLNLTVDTLDATVNSDGIKVTKINVTDSVKLDWSLNPVLLKLPAITLKVENDQLTLEGQPSINIGAGGACKSDDVTAKFSFATPVTGKGPLEMDWGLSNAGFSCDLAGFKTTVTGLNVWGKSIPNVKIDVFDVDFGGAAKYFKSVWSSDAEPKDPASPVGVKFTGIGYYGDEQGNGRAAHPGSPAIYGLSDAQKEIFFQVPFVGAGVKAVMDFSGLLSLNPGIMMDSITLKLPKSLGGNELPTNFKVKVDGNSPYLHPSGNFGSIGFSVPKIMLLGSQSIEEASMRLVYKSSRKKACRDDQPCPAPVADRWVLEGTASMNLSGAIEKIAVELAMQAPDEKTCRVGICKASLTLKMASNSRIPIGTTGLYISGARGGFYDGEYAPQCATDCLDGHRLPNGMKVELALFVELKNPYLANGEAGFWVQIDHFNFGLNGKLKMMGVADASACLAFLQGGTVVHGKVNVSLETPLAVEGYFVMDLWEDGGAKFAAEAGASLGLSRASIIRCRWFKFPRSRWWMGPIVTRMGAFANGASGFTGGVRALGRTWGVGYVGRFVLGNVGQYRLASPFSGGTPLLGGDVADTSMFTMVPLGIEVQGGEVLTAAVGSAVGTDWQGAQLSLVDRTAAAGSTDELGQVTSATIGFNASQSYEDKANTEKSDSTNLHSLVWTNPGLKGARPYLAIPRKRGTVQVSGEEAEDVGLQDKSDDVQFLATFADPKPNVKAKVCPDGKDVCFSGEVQNFRKGISSIKRVFKPEELAILKNATEEQKKPQEIVRQRHLLKAWAMDLGKVDYSLDPEAEDTTTSDTFHVKADTAIPVELDVTSFVGAQPGSESIGDLPCASKSASDSTRLILDNCRLKPGVLPSGTYGFLVGALARDYNLHDPNDTSAQDVFLERSRRWSHDAGSTAVQDSAARFVLQNPFQDTVRNLTVYGSALTGTQSQQDERRTFSVRWDPVLHRDVVGYTLYLKYSDSSTERVRVGRRARWSRTLIGLPGGNDSTAQILRDKITDASVRATLERIDSLPISITVLPRVRVTGQRWHLKDVVSAGATWKIANRNAVLGTSAVVAPAPAVTLGPVDAISLGLDSAVTRPLAITSQADPSGALAGRWMRGELTWVDGSGQPLAVSDTDGYPRASLLRETWLADLESDTVLVTAPSQDLKCPDRMVSDSLCHGVVRKGTQLGTYRLRLRVWNQAHLRDDAYRESFVTVVVHPPIPLLQLTEPDYLVAGQTQTHTLTISRRWKGAGKAPQLRVLNINGDSLAFKAGAAKAQESELTQTVAWDLRVPLVDTGINLKDTLTWKLPGVTGDSLILEVSNLDKEGQRWANRQKVKLLDNFQELDCRKTNVRDTTRNREYAMDFVGFYPKVLRSNDTAFALFSELLRPGQIHFTAKGRDSAVKLATLTGIDQVKIVIPANLTGTKLPLDLNIPDESAGKDCKDQHWRDTLRILPALTAQQMPQPIQLNHWKVEVPLGQVMAAADAQQDVLAWPSGVELRPTEQIEWRRGTPRFGMRPYWTKGLPLLGEVSQPDEIHLRLRETEGNSIVQAATYLIQTPARRLDVVQGTATVARTATLPLGTRLRTGYAPAATQGQDGTSTPRQQCRWNNGPWALCPESWTLTLQNQGTFESRMVWLVNTSQGQQEVAEPVQSWTLQAQSLESQGLTTQVLTLEGERLREVLSEASEGNVVLLRRQGDQLQRWAATPPRVRDEGGTLLPQMTETYDSTARIWEAWVALGRLEPGHNRTLILTLGDTSTVALPWEGTRQGSGSNVAGQVGQAALVSGQTLTQTLGAATSTNGWSASLWMRWNGEARTLLKTMGRDTLILQALGDGGLQLTFRRLVWRTRPILDVREPMLIGVDWSGADGTVRFWANGQKVAEQPWTAPDAGLFLSQQGTWGCAGSWCDELRFDHPHTAAQWRLRWEGERAHSRLWDAWSIPGAFRPAVLRPQGAVRALVAGVQPWSDRDAQVQGVPAAWREAAWLPGMAWKRGSDSTTEPIVTLPGARLCAVGDTLGMEDGEAAGTLAFQDRSLTVACRTLGMDGTAKLRTGAGRSCAWLVLPPIPVTTDGPVIGTQTTFPGGDGTGRPGAVPAVIRGGNAVRGQAGPDSTTRYQASTGKLLLVVPVGEGVPAACAPLVQTFTGTNSQGQTVSWEIHACPDGSVDLPKNRTDVLVVRTEPSWVTALPLGNGLREVTRGQSLVLPDGTVADSLTMASPVVLPRTCGDWVAQANYGTPVRLHLWSPITAPIPQSLAWSLQEIQEAVGLTWGHWTRSWSEGTWQEDLSKWLPGTCARYVLAAEALAVVAPDWTLDQVRLRGLGGARSVVGGLHRIDGLDLEFAASHVLESPLYRMRLEGGAGQAERLAGVALGLGPDREVRLADSTSGQSSMISVRSRLPLAALRAGRLDADSVTVDVTSLLSTGRVRVRVHNYGGKDFAGGGRMVLYRDLDGNATYSDNDDQALGAQALPAVPTGDSVVLEFPVDGQRRNYPEELYFAWIEPLGLRALQSGDHDVQGGSLCHERKSLDWVRASAERAEGIGEDALPEGVATLRVHLRDTDHDGRWTERDSTDALWVTNGQVCRSHVSGVVDWCRHVDGASRSEDLVVRDLLGRGVPQILVGQTVLDTSGAVLWQLGQRTSDLTLDADEDGRADHYTVSGTCQQLTLASGVVVWSTGCSGTYRTFAWKDLARDPLGCGDLSLSSLKAGSDGLLAVRVANAGTVDLAAGALLDVVDPQGMLQRSYQLPALKAGTWTNLLLDEAAKPGQSVRVERRTLEDQGYFDHYLGNNARALTPANNEE